MCTNVVHGSLYCPGCYVFIAVPCKSMTPGFCYSGLGWMTIHLNNTYGFIRHGTRDIHYAWHEKLLPGMTVLDAMITYDRRIGTRFFHAGSAKFCIFFEPAGRIRISGPWVAGTTRALRQAAVRFNKANPQADPRVRPASQQKTSHGSRWRDPRVTRISLVMTRHDPRDFYTP